MGKINGQKIISGSKANMWLNGKLMAEVKSVESKASINRETIQMAGSYDEDSKITSIGCEGSFVVNKVYTTEKDFVESFQKGVDTRFQLYVTLNDPDSFGRESTQLDNCWLNEVTIAQFEVGSILQREFPFGHTFSDIKYAESITAQ